jgi:hypothetical protein
MVYIINALHQKNTNCSGCTESLFTVDDALDRCGVWGAHHWLLLLYTGIAWTYYSMQIMMSSFVGPVVACQWDLSASQEGLLTSVVFAGE